MTRPTIRIHNISTDEVIDREMNDAEFAQYEIDQAKETELQEAKVKVEAEKTALLAKRGITADEAKLLLS